MPSYVESILAPQERVLYSGKVSLFSILSALVGGILLVAIGAAVALIEPIAGAAVAVLGIAWLATGLIKRSSTELAVTDRRVIAKFGFVSRSTIELNLAKVESVRVEQSVMGRMLGYGTVYVTGTGSTMDPIPFIADPIRFRQAIQAATDALQRR